MPHNNQHSLNSITNIKSQQTLQEKLRQKFWTQLTFSSFCFGWWWWRWVNVCFHNDGWGLRWRLAACRGLSPAFGGFLLGRHGTILSPWYNPFPLMKNLNWLVGSSFCGLVLYGKPTWLGRIITKLVVAWATTNRWPREDIRQSNVIYPPRGVLRIRQRFVKSVVYAMGALIKIN